MKNLVVLYFTLATGISCLAQSTPEDLGKAAFAAFRSENLDLLNDYFPTPEKMLAKTRALGIEFTSKQEIDFKTNFPLQINRYKMQCNAMFNSNLGKQILWENTVFVSTIKRVKQVPISEENPENMIDATNVEIHFTSGKKAYYLTLNQCLEIEGIWFLGGGQVLLFEE